MGTLNLSSLSTHAYPKCIRALLSTTLRLALLLNISGIVACGKIDTTNKHLGAMDANTEQLLEEFKQTQKALDIASHQSERIADSMEILAKLGVDMSALLQQMLQKKTPAQSDDIGDVLGQNPLPSKTKQQE